MEEDDSLIRDLKIATDLYSSNCNKVYDLSKERKLVRPAFARQLDVDNFRSFFSFFLYLEKKRDTVVV